MNVRQTLSLVRQFKKLILRVSLSQIFMDGITPRKILLSQKSHNIWTLMMTIRKMLSNLSRPRHAHQSSSRHPSLICQILTKLQGLIITRFRALMSPSSKSMILNKKRKLFPISNEILTSMSRTITKLVQSLSSKTRSLTL